MSDGVSLPLPQRASHRKGLCQPNGLPFANRRSGSRSTSWRWELATRGRAVEGQAPRRGSCAGRGLGAQWEPAGPGVALVRPPPPQTCGRSLRTRRRESHSQEDLRNQLQNTVHELEAAKCLKEDMLKDSNTQIEQLRKMMLSHEGVLQEIRSILVDFEEASGKKICEHDSMSTIHFRNLGSAISKILRELDTEISYLKGRIFPIEELEKQLVLANSELTEARTERDQFSQESGNLDDQLQKLLADLHKREKELSLEKEQNKRLWDRDTGNSITIDHLRRELDDRNMEVQRLEALLKAMKSECQGQMERQMAAIQGKNESLEKVSSLTAQLESTKEMLRKVVEELTAKKMTLESSERTVSDLTASLQEKERAIEATNAEITKLRSRVDLKLQELQHLKNEGDHLRNVQTECEALKLQMAEKDKVIEILRQQIENMTQLVGQHGRTAGAMQVEKAQLEKEINDRKLELQEFKILKDKKDAKIRELEARMSDLELEKVKLVNAGSERLRAVKDIRQERDQLLNEVKTSRTELNSLSAMKVAMGMQKQITAKRGQIDALQSKVQFLEEAVTSANKEKHFLKEEKSKLSQELSTVATEKNKMAGELEVLRSQERRLKEKVANMEVALDKHSVKTNTLKEDPTRDLKQLLQELRSVINEEPAMPLSKTEEDGRTPSLGAL
ncbi:coiled-coil domain containing 158 [Cricetulus griseus]